MEKQIISLSPSLLDTVQTCFKKVEYRHVERIVPISHTPVLDRGDLFHVMLKHLLNARKATPGEDYKTQVQNAAEAGCLRAAALDVEQSILGLVIDVFQRYCKEYRYDTWRVIEVEQPVTKVLYEDEDVRMDFNGIIDLIAEVPQEGHLLLVVDHKLTSSLYPPQKLQNQTMGYCWGMNLTRAAIDQVTVGGKFKRTLLAYQENVIERWARDAVKWGFLILAMSGSEVWPMNYRGCRAFGGCWYEKLCDNSERMHEKIKLTDYKFLPEREK